MLLRLSSEFDVFRKLSVRPVSISVTTVLDGFSERFSAIAEVRSMALAITFESYGQTRPFSWAALVASLQLSSSTDKSSFASSFIGLAIVFLMTEVSTSADCPLSSAILSRTVSASSVCFILIVVGSVTSGKVSCRTPDKLSRFSSLISGFSLATSPRKVALHRGPIFGSHASRLVLLSPILRRSRLSRLSPSRTFTGISRRHFTQAGIRTGLAVDFGRLSKAMAGFNV